MIILKDYETIIREDRAQLIDSNNNLIANGKLYLTNERLVFEKEDESQARVIALNLIQSVTPINSYSFKATYKSDKSPSLTAIYKMISSQGAATAEDWIRDFQRISGIS
jgi:hypothetical protein